jgi:hypothetical protein
VVCRAAKRERGEKGVFDNPLKRLKGESKTKMANPVL